MSCKEFDPDLIRSLRERIDRKKGQLDAAPAGFGLIPLGLKCTMTSCTHGRHCLDHLRKPNPKQGQVAPGSCRDCGEPVVSMETISNHSLGSLERISAICLEQQSELIRAHYWHVPIDLWAYNQARRMGRLELYRRVEARVTVAMTGTDVWSGRTAPYDRDIVGYAQHATAACCRKCAAYWHGTPLNPANVISADQLAHIIRAAKTWFDVRMPELPPNGQKVQNIGKDLLPDSTGVATLDDKLMERIGSGADPSGLVQPKDTNLRIRAAKSTIYVERTIELREAL